jgi:HEAT repeat protein
MDAPAFTEVLKRIGSMTTADQATLLTQGLHSHDHGVHRLAIGALTPSLVPLLPRGVFATQLNGMDAKVRAKARELAIEMEDPTTAVPLASLLALQRTGIDERRALYAALVKLGSPKVTPALVEELERQKDADVRVEIAKAIGAIGDARAVPGLEAVAAKLLTPANVKSACKVAAALVRRRPPTP